MTTAKEERNGYAVLADFCLAAAYPATVALRCAVLTGDTEHAAEILRNAIACTPNEVYRACNALLTNCLESSQLPDVRNAADEILELRAALLEIHQRGFVMPIDQGVVINLCEQLAAEMTLTDSHLDNPSVTTLCERVKILLFNHRALQQRNAQLARELDSLKKQRIFPEVTPQKEETGHEYTQRQLADPKRSEAWKLVMGPGHPYPWPEAHGMYTDSGPPTDMEFNLGEVNFKVTLTKHFGCDSGRRRYRVECLTCSERAPESMVEGLLHEATTGPGSRIRSHVQHCHEWKEQRAAPIGMQVIRGPWSCACGADVSGETCPCGRTRPL